MKKNQIELLDEYRRLCLTIAEIKCDTSVEYAQNYNEIQTILSRLLKITKDLKLLEDIKA